MAELDGSDGFLLLRRVEVLRLSAWVASFLARQGLDFFGQSSHQARAPSATMVPLAKGALKAEGVVPDEHRNQAASK